MYKKTYKKQEYWRNIIKLHRYPIYSLELKKLLKKKLNFDNIP